MLNRNSAYHFTFLILSIAVFSVGCKKKTKYTISGSFHSTCSATVNDAKIDVRQRSTAYVDYSGGSIGTFKTDKSGNFSYKYKQLDNGSTDLSLFDGDAANATVIMSGIPANYDVNLNLYQYKNVDLTYTINYTSTAASLYTAFDTLYIGGKPFAGPFTKGEVLGPITETPDVNFYNYETKDYTTCWGVTLPDYWASTQSLGRYHEYHVIHYQMPACGAVQNLTIQLQ